MLSCLQVGASLSALGQGSAPAGPSSAGAAPALPLPPRMPTLLYLLGSPTFRGVAVSEALVVSLASLLTAVLGSGAPGLQDVKVWRCAGEREVWRCGAQAAELGLSAGEPRS